ncbi:hypothetical protein BI347_15470 [Chromobacterium sphagni]|uniref:Lysozyme inhibitor LprI-like N-terminal domain-containing protein n=2 Tax=Chromobacterium sphagni TaxID=1903179 RepID=A0A1S1X5L1_9NEIS|nr:hypothetical protein BI347_15470 [Chromobacterium sphagni]OHX16505.1 hypothetical protein BI344_21475 [Chromobacterium sphagni]
MLALCASHAVHAEDDPCQNANTTLEINDCKQQQFDAKDKQLNQIYRELLQKLQANESQGGNPGVKDKPSTLLIQAQRKWIAFRDADCNTKYQIYLDGSIRNMVYLGCKIERTAQRIKELDPKLW